MNTHGKVEVQLHECLILPLDGGELLASRHGRFTSAAKAPGTHCTGGWVNPRGGDRGGPYFFHTPVPLKVAPHGILCPIS
jgi:hypothetical protein